MNAPSSWPLGVITRSGQYVPTDAIETRANARMLKPPIPALESIVLKSLWMPFIACLTALLLVGCGGSTPTESKSAPSEKTTGAGEKAPAKDPSHFPSHSDGKGFDTYSASDHGGFGCGHGGASIHRMPSSPCDTLSACLRDVLRTTFRRVS